MPSEETNAATRSEWRDLGFYYDKDDLAKTWRLVGSRSGLHRFAALLRAYAADPRNRHMGEHEHHGPYMYLEIGTSHVPQITDHWIAGPLTALDLLATAVETALGPATVGDRISMRAGFAPSAVFDLILEVRPADFDPASEDHNCW